MTRDSGLRLTGWGRCDIFILEEQGGKRSAQGQKSCPVETELNALCMRI